MLGRHSLFLFFHLCRFPQYKLLFSWRARFPTVPHVLTPSGLRPGLPCPLSGGQTTSSRSQLSALSNSMAELGAARVLRHTPCYPSSPSGGGVGVLTTSSLQSPCIACDCSCELHFSLQHSQLSSSLINGRWLSSYHQSAALYRSILHRAEVSQSHFMSMGTQVSSPQPTLCEGFLWYPVLFCCWSSPNRLLTSWHCRRTSSCLSWPCSRAGAGAGVSNAFVRAPGFSEIVLLLTHHVSEDKSLPFLSPNFSSLKEHSYNEHDVPVHRVTV